MGFEFADLNHEWLDSEVITVHNAPSEYHWMVWSAAKTARPIFCRRHGGGMDYKFVRVHVKGGCRLQTSYVWTVSEFSLRVTACNSECLDISVPLFLLFGATKLLYRISEHSIVECKQVYTGCKSKRHQHSTLDFVKVFVCINGHEFSIFLPMPLLLLFFCHF